MIKLSVMYPYEEGAHFDFEYYRATHIPLVLDWLGAACKRCSVDRGVRGGRPDAPPLYAAGCHLEFDSVDAFSAAFGPHAKEILADTPNYTNISPVTQVSETYS